MNIHKHKCVDSTKMTTTLLENAFCTVSNLLTNQLTETRCMVCIKLKHLNDKLFQVITDKSTITLMQLFLDFLKIMSIINNAEPHRQQPQRFALSLHDYPFDKYCISAIDCLLLLRCSSKQRIFPSLHSC